MALAAVMSPSRMLATLIMCMMGTFIVSMMIILMSALSRLTAQIRARVPLHMTVARILRGISMEQVAGIRRSRMATTSTISPMAICIMRMVTTATTTGRFAFSTRSLTSWIAREGV